MDTSSLIIGICVVIPAIIAFIVCTIIIYSNRNKNRKFYGQRSSSDEHHPSSERIPPDNYIIDFSRTHRYQQEHRLSQPPPSVFEQSSPTYNSYSVNQTGRQQLPLFSTVHTIPSTTHVITPSRYSARPPSYAEIFLTPQTLTNR